MKVLDYSYKKITNRKGARRYSKLYSNNSGSEEGRRETKETERKTNGVLPIEAAISDSESRSMKARSQSRTMKSQSEVGKGTERRGDERLALIVTHGLDESERRGDE